jgi:hypothetical protein
VSRDVKRKRVIKREVPVIFHQNHQRAFTGKYAYQETGVFFPCQQLLFLHRGNKSIKQLTPADKENILHFF